MNSSEQKSVLRPQRFSMSGKLAPALAAVGLAMTLCGGAATADDVNVHPASCQAPFLDQAFPMRWHEYFIMNPTSGVDTWVICPVTFDNDEYSSGDSFDINARGGVMSGASGDIPTCIFSVNDEENLDQPGFVSGTRRVYEQALSVTRSGSGWNGSTTVDYDDIATAVVGNKNGWAMAVRCKLPIGHGVSQIALIE